MRTIGRHWPTKTPQGDYSALCDICGTLWRRSELTRKRDGLLYCPQDADGDDPVTLAEANASYRSRPVPHHRGGNYPTKDSEITVVRITTIEGVEGD